MKNKYFAPLFVCFDATYKCNLNCIHCCFAGDNGEEAELNTREVVSLIRRLDELNIFSFQFAGGEPFVRSDFYRLIEETGKCKFSTSIATNGMFIDNDVASFLKKNRVTHVQVSLDGHNQDSHEYIRGENTFQSTLSGIRCLQEQEIDVSVAALLYKKNIAHVEDLCKFVASIGVTKLRFQLLLLQGEAVANKEMLYVNREDLYSTFQMIPFLEKKYGIKIITPCFVQFLNNGNKSYLGNVGCGAGITSVNINPYGYVSACGILTDKMYSAGNVRNNDLLDIWQDQSKWEEWRGPTDKIKGKCAKCDILQSCRGGCRANAYLYKGDFFAEDPLCWYRGK